MSDEAEQLRAENKNARVPTELHCPVCKTLHVDQDDWVHKIPHRKHLCASCRHIWQPYAVGTVGVDFHEACRRDGKFLVEERAECLKRELAHVAENGRMRAEMGAAKYRAQELEQRTQELERDLAWTRSEWSAAGEDIQKLEQRRDELLEMVAKLSQTVPLESEVGEALNQRGALLAANGTLKASIAAYERTLQENEELFKVALADHQFIADMLKGIGPFVPRATQSNVVGIVGAVKTMHEAVKELQRALHAVCERATTHLPEDREVINEMHKLAHKDYFA